MRVNVAISSSVSSYILARVRKVILIAILALATSGCAQILSSGAAVVNGDRISQSAVDDEVKAQLSGGQQQTPQTADSQVQIARQVLGRLIQQKLLLQEAARRSVVAAPAKVNEQYAQLRGQFQDEAEFRKRLADFSLTPETLKERIRDSIVIDALGAKISGPVTDDQVRAVYKKEQAQFREVRFKHILFTVDAKHPDVTQHDAALAARAKILAGADFGALAKKFSGDAGSKDKGGVYDYQPLSGLDPTFADAAWAAKVGVITQPVRSQFGWHLIVTLGKRVQSFDQVKEKLRTQLATAATQGAQNDFLRAAIKRAQVIVNPRYGDWDAATASIVAHENFAPAENSVDENAPGGFADQPVFAVPSASP